MNKSKPVEASASIIHSVVYSQTKRRQLLKKFGTEMRDESRKVFQNLTKQEKSKGSNSTYNRGRKFTGESALKQSLKIQEIT